MTTTDSSRVDPVAGIARPENAETSRAIGEVPESTLGPAESSALDPAESSSSLTPPGLPA